MAKGTFIVLEGGEGSGKSTCIKRLMKELHDESFVFTREPGGQPKADDLRKIYLANDYGDVSRLLFMETMRAIHMEEKVRPALAEGKHVISDRSSASTYAYQIVAPGAEHLHELFLEIERWSVGDAQPDLWIDFRLDPEEGIRRKEDSGDKLNVFDKKKMAFHKKVRTGYDEFFQDKNVKTIDASQPKEEVFQEALRAIQEITNAS